MEWFDLMWLYPRFWGFSVQTRDSLAAVIRVLRSARTLSVDDFASSVDPKHINNLENGKVSPTIEMLEAVAEVLNVSPIALLLLSSTVRDGRTPEQTLKDLREEVRHLTKTGMANQFPAQFSGGKLVSRARGARVNQENLAAVLTCKSRGLTPSEAAKKLGMPVTTVRRYWLQS